MDRTRMAQWVEASERPMLLLALFAVALYVADLAGAWTALGLVDAYRVVGGVVDLVFLADLLLKIAAQRGEYLRSAWFVVDLVCTLPVLSAVGAPEVLRGLRFVRAFRLLRALRMLRMLRSLRVLRLVAASQGEETSESVVYQRVLTASVLLYSLVFVSLVSGLKASRLPGEVLGLAGAAQGAPIEVLVRGDDGVVQTVSMTPERLFAHPDDIELHLVLGSLLGMTMILVVARYQIPALFSRQMKALLNVALPEQVARHFLDHPETYEQNVRAPATVMFCDIKGFTNTVEKLPLEEVKGHLERALDVVVEAHRAQDLIIDKFIGDAVMSFRGGNIAGGDPADMAYRVVRAALDGMAALAALDDPWFKEIKCGGASATDALIGAFGTSRRLSYTVVGDRVNLAARLEASCNAVGVSNLFCDRTHALTADRPDLVWRRVGSLRVQGKDEVTVAWQVFDAADEPQQWIALWHRGLEHWEARRFAEAAACFAEVESRVDDVPARLLRARAEVLARDGVPDDWSPVLETRK